MTAPADLIFTILTGCLKNVELFLENAVTPSFMEKTFTNFLWYYPVDTRVYQWCFIIRWRCLQEMTS